MNISVGDGFRFGCGFILAWVVFYTLLAIAVLALLVILNLIGAPVSLPPVIVPPAPTPAPG